MKFAKKIEIKVTVKDNPFLKEQRFRIYKDAVTF